MEILCAIDTGVLCGVEQWFTDPAQWTGPAGIPVRLAEHVYYSVLALLVATAIAVPLGLLTGHTGVGGFLTTSLANFARALPTIGVLFLIVLLAGIGLVPVLCALVALAVPPILVNTHEGVRGVEPRLKDAALGMGMRGREVLFKLELPVAAPLVLIGMRTAAVQVVATATIAAYVGVGGLGRYIVDGQARQDLSMMLGGSILVVALAVVTTLLFAGLRRVLVAPGLRAEAASAR
ncbi:ABC transporter permease [Nocardiopsis aegyptia]|uniref:ABC transporter permease n=1 Tax=Nocardiopsis aegyptia TaxID=220378 RepID=UPI0036727239